MNHRVATLVARMAACWMLTTAPAAANDAATVLSQYTETWSVEDGFRPGEAKWDPSASFHLVFGVMPQTHREIAAAGMDDSSRIGYETHFRGVLAEFAREVNDRGLVGEALVTALRTFLDQRFAITEPWLKKQWPGLAVSAYRALLIQNLVHGYHRYATSWYYEAITDQMPSRPSRPTLVLGELTAASEMRALLSLPTADCGEIAELVRVMGRLWGLDVRYLGISGELDSRLAQQRMQTGTHAINALLYRGADGSDRVFLIDALTNFSIDLGRLRGEFGSSTSGDNILGLRVDPSDRLPALAQAGLLRGFFNVHMSRGYRDGSLMSGAPDGSLIRFMYAYYLEAYPAVKVNGVTVPTWFLNSAPWSLNQPPF